MTPLSDVRAVLFDMDGTLVDSDAAVERAWRTWAAKYGFAEADVLAIAHGSPADVTVRKLAPSFSDDEVETAARMQLQMQYTDLDGVALMPGASEILRHLDETKMPWAVVTSADRRLAGVRLGAVGIAPPVLVTSEDVDHGKPNPEGYLQAAKLLSYEPAVCLVVEDSAPGIEAGHAAGMRVAALRGLNGDIEIADLEQLKTLLQS